MQARRFRLPAAALAAGLPVLLAGMVGAPSPRVLVGPPDDTVRTMNVDPPPASATDADLGLDGAHPPMSTALQVEDAVSRDKGHGEDRKRGVPIRVSGAALPARVLIAYRNAAGALRRSDPACQLHWSLVAGIGQVESGHAYGGALDRRGRTLSPILGPVLDGAGDFAAISDSDAGDLDGDRTWDRAVGPMQFIPTSWAVWGRDGDGDGRSDPSDIDDAALATASYLCAGDGDLTVEKDRRGAVFSYNHSWDYVDLVLAWADAYATGTPPATVQQVGARGGRAGGDGGGGGATGRVIAPVVGPAASAPTAAASPTSTPEAAPTSTETPAPTTPTHPAEPPRESAAPTVAPDPAPSSSPPPGPEPTATSPAPCPTATPTGSPTGTETGDPTATPTDTPTPTDSPSPSPTPTPTESCGPPAP